MRHIIMFVLFTMLVVSTKANAESKLTKQILRNKPSINLKYAEALSSIFSGLCKDYGVPCNVIVAISFVESSYVIGSYNKRSKDYGLMQVNEWHVRYKKLSKHLLLTDAAYNINEGIKIYLWFYKTYGKFEGIKRYNCGTRRACIKHKNVIRYYNRVKRAM